MTRPIDPPLSSPFFRLRVFLYHIPPVAGVPISHTLIERLLKAYPKIVGGIKDSSGDWEHTESLIKHFGKPASLREEDAGDFLRVFAGVLWRLRFCCAGRLIDLLSSLLIRFHC